MGELKDTLNVHLSSTCRGASTLQQVMGRNQACLNDKEICERAENRHNPLCYYAAKVKALPRLVTTHHYKIRLMYKFDISCALSLSPTESLLLSLFIFFVVAL